MYNYVKARITQLYITGVKIELYIFLDPLSHHRGTLVASIIKFLAPSFDLSPDFRNYLTNLTILANV